MSNSSRAAAMCVFGFIALIVGITLHAHFGAMAGLCNSGLGAIGQAFSPSVHSQCTRDTLWSGLGIWMAIFGGLSALGGAISAWTANLDRRASRQGSLGVRNGI
jgi:hypothetical protein